MFTKISWEDYFIVVGLLLAGYYVFVGLRYYSNDVKNLLSGKRKLGFRKSQVNKPFSEISSTGQANYPDSSAEVDSDSVDDQADIENLVERLKAVIAEASGKKLIPSEFTRYLKLVLREFPNISNSPYRFSINELITSECKKYGTVTLNEDEVEMLWKDN